jgi:ligand-binding SRPBCC domain-containing protein
MSSPFHFVQWVPFPLQQVFLFVACPANLPRIMPPKTATRIETLHLVPPPASESNHPYPRKSGKSVADLAGVGSEITTSFRVLPWLPFRATWVSLITEFEWNHHFADIQKLGPFRSFHHRHELKAEISDGIAGTVVSDTIELDLGYGWSGKMIEKLFVSRQMHHRFRHRQTALLKLLST